MWGVQPDLRLIQQAGYKCLRLVSGSEATLLSVHADVTCDMIMLHLTAYLKKARIMLQTLGESPACVLP